MIELIIEGATIFFMFLGALLLLIAGIGLVRMPDLFLRMSATTKGATLGATSLLIAAALHFGELSTFAQISATIFFLFITAPVGAHIIGRAAYRKKRATLYERTSRDDLESYYENEL
ncbi:MAG: monovalent cation/H(+) antiporter subunit G [Candidatus Promineifilaceae bacterium]